MAAPVSGNQFWDGVHNTFTTILRGDKRATMIYLLEEIASFAATPGVAADVTLGVGYVAPAATNVLITIPAGARSFTIYNAGPDPIAGNWGDDLALSLGLTFTADGDHEVLPAITFTVPTGTVAQYATTTR